MHKRLRCCLMPFLCTAWRLSCPICCPGAALSFKAPHGLPVAMVEGVLPDVQAMVACNLSSALRCCKPFCTACLCYSASKLPSKAPHGVPVAVMEDMLWAFMGFQGKYIRLKQGLPLKQGILYALTGRLEPALHELISRMLPIW